jgi:hypothetical protein
MTYVAESGFGEAVKALLAERRRQLREHITLQELADYHRRALSAERQEVVAEHLAVCEDCTILLLYAVIGLNGNEHRNEPLESEIEATWDQLQLRLKERSSRGRSLASLLQESRLPIEEALPLALEISRALMVLHSQGRVLPDLRTENVLISAGQVQLLERGFAPTPESLEVGYGQPAELAVSDLYRTLSPEQIAGEEPSQRSNLFSLGVLLYELLTGVSPFRGETPLSTATGILSLEPRPARELNPAVEPSLSNLLSRLLAKEPEDRPLNAKAVVREIEVLLGRRGPEAHLEVEEEIEDLYDKLIVLAQQPAANQALLDDEIERSYTRLRELQTAEAKRFREQFETNLAMPIDAGEEILTRIRALKEELEDLASANAAASEADKT